MLQMCLVEAKPKNGHELIKHFVFQSLTNGKGDHSV